MKKPLSELFPSEQFRSHVVSLVGPPIQDKDPRKPHRATVEEAIIDKLKLDSNNRQSVQMSTDIASMLSSYFADPVRVASQGDALGGAKTFETEIDLNQQSLTKAPSPSILIDE